MQTNLPYDKYSDSSIEEYSKLLVDKSFREVLPVNHKTFKGKGGLGQLLEKYHFMYEPNSDKHPDFKEAGVELKVAPFKINKNGKFAAKERIVLNIINYMDIVKETFEDSSFLYKNKMLLLVFYHYLKGSDRLDYIIRYSSLFTYSLEDLKIIKDDWEKIVNKIKEGKAHELSEGDTFYLGACTKGKNSDSLRPQPFFEEDAMQRAFSLKTKYVTHVLNTYILRDKEKIEPIIKSVDLIKNKTFEDYIIEIINNHSGKAIDELASEFGVEIGNLKDFAHKIALRILGVKTNHALEFEKANVRIKAIRIEKNDKIKQHMSFPTFKFTELIKENWEDSELRNLFFETKFLFVIFKFDNNGVLRLKKGVFWNMPLTDLDGEVKSVWGKTVNTIKNGVEIWQKGNRTCNNLPNPSESEILHVRPHAQKKINTYPLPDGRELTKQCFWLKNSYILEHVKKEL